MRCISESKIISRVRRKSNSKKYFIIILAVVVLQFAAVEALIIYGGKSDDEVRTDYLIILGAGLNGETVSLTLRERLAAGLPYLKKYPDAKVIVSGGQGRKERITEAEAMRRFLVAGGIDEDRILLETKSTSTMENFKFSKRIIVQNSEGPVPDVTFITNRFHVLRSKMIAGRNGLNAHAISCKTPVQVVVQQYFREYLALIKSFIIDR